VDNDLASEPIGVLLDGLLDAGAVDGEDDYLAAERSRGVEDARGAAKLVGERLTPRRPANRSTATCAGR